MKPSAICSGDRTVTRQRLALARRGGQGVEGQAQASVVVWRGIAGGQLV